MVTSMRREALLKRARLSNTIQYKIESKKRGRIMGREKAWKLIRTISRKTLTSLAFSFPRFILLLFFFFLLHFFYPWNYRLVLLRSSRGSLIFKLRSLQWIFKKNLLARDKGIIWLFQHSHFVCLLQRSNFSQKARSKLGKLWRSIDNCYWE